MEAEMTHWFVSTEGKNVRLTLYNQEGQWVIAEICPEEVEKLVEELRVRLGECA